MSDIVERLMKVPQRVKEGFLIFWSHDYPLCREAAAEILRLRAENEKLRERLEKAHSFISRADWMQFFEEEHAAAAALKETGDE